MKDCRRSTRNGGSAAAIVLSCAYDSFKIVAVADFWATFDLNEASVESRITPDLESKFNRELGEMMEGSCGRATICVSVS